MFDEEIAKIGKTKSKNASLKEFTKNGKEEKQKK